MQEYHAQHAVQNSETQVGITCKSGEQERRPIRMTWNFLGQIIHNTGFLMALWTWDQNTGDPSLAPIILETSHKLVYHQ